MNPESIHPVKTVSVRAVIFLSVFALSVGTMAGIVICKGLLDKRETATGSDAKQRIMADQINMLERQLTKDPDSVDSWTQLGNLYFDTDQYQKAIEAYQRSLALEPNSPDVWTDLGIMYRSVGKPQEALKAFDRAMAIDPKHENSRFDKGVVLMHDLNDKESAIKAWEELSRINPFYQLPDGKLIEEVVLSYKAEQKADGRSDDAPSGKPEASPSQGQGTPNP